tara:strand:+ start:1022 stop:1495 length:474 start_codon:yes stop_codon:yes gene_type:complete
MRKRSKYRPKGVLPDPMTWLLAGMKPFKEVPFSVDLRIKNHGSMDALRRGVATKDDIDVLISAFNMTEAYVRLRPDLGADWVEEIKAGLDALHAVAVRGAKSMRFILKAQELVAMNLVMEIHDVQLDQTTVKDLEQAMDIAREEYRLRKMRAIREKV